MPVEECGNMLILLVALVETTGDTGYAKRYWGLVTQWADYLVANGLNPGRQLCTDDFAGHLAQNANLALEVSRYGYVLETGRVTLQDTSSALRQNPQVQSAYLGGG